MKTIKPTIPLLFLLPLVGFPSSSTAITYGSAMDVVNKWQQPSQITPPKPKYLEPFIVRRVQETLKDKGYFRDRVDGIVGSKTRDAIRWFQQDQGLVADGRISDDILDRLNIDIKSSCLR